MRWKRPGTASRLAIPAAICRRGDIEADPRANGRQNVVHVDPPHQRRANFDLSSRRLRRELQAFEGEPEFLRGNVGRAGQSIGQRAPSQALDARRIRIVRVDHRRIRRSGPSAFEQVALGREIVFEGLVIIEMVAREISEHGHREMAAPQPVHGERVRTGLQHRMGAARVAHLGEHLVQVE